MKHTILPAIILLQLTGPASLLAEEHSLSADLTETASPAAAVAATVNSDIPRPIYGKCMMNEGAGHRGKCMLDEGTGHGSKCMMHGGQGKHGKDHGCMKYGGNHEGKGQYDKHDQVTHRLDMIEARISKIEAMLEILLQR